MCWRSVTGRGVAGFLFANHGVVASHGDAGRDVAVCGVAVRGVAVRVFAVHGVAVRGVAVCGVAVCCVAVHGVAGGGIAAGVAGGGATCRGFTGSVADPDPVGSEPFAGSGSGQNVQIWFRIRQDKCNTRCLKFSNILHEIKNVNFLIRCIGLSS